MLKNKKLQFLSTHYLGDKRIAIIKNNYTPVQNNFWYSVFAHQKSTKKIEELFHKNKKTDNLPKKEKEEIQNLEKQLRE